MAASFESKKARVSISAIWASFIFGLSLVCRLKGFEAFNLHTRWF